MACGIVSLEKNHQTTQSDNKMIYLTVVVVHSKGYESTEQEKERF